MIAYQRDMKGFLLSCFPWYLMNQLMSIPAITGNTLPKAAAMSCPPSASHDAVCSKTLLQTCTIPLFIKPLMSLSLTLGSFLWSWGWASTVLAWLWVTAQQGPCKMFGFSVTLIFYKMLNADDLFHLSLVMWHLTLLSEMSVCFTGLLRNRFAT